MAIRPLVPWAVDYPGKAQYVIEVEVGVEVVDVGGIVDHPQNRKCIFVDQVQNEDLWIEGYDREGRTRPIAH